MRVEDRLSLKLTMLHFKMEILQYVHYLKGLNVILLNFTVSSIGIKDQESFFKFTPQKR